MKSQYVAYSITVEQDAETGVWSYSVRGRDSGRWVAKGNALSRRGARNRARRAARRDARAVPLTEPYDVDV